MLYFLLSMLFLLFIFSYSISPLKFLSPTVLSCIIFMIGTIASIVGNQSWDMTITDNATMIILLGIGCMFIGEIFTIFVKQNRNTANIRNEQVKCEIFIPQKYVYSFCFISVISVLLYYIRLCNIAGVSYTNFTGMLSVINYIRHNNDVHIGTFIAGLLVVGNLSYYYFLFSFINNITISENKRNTFRKYRYYLIQTVPFILYIVIGGSRIFFIPYMCFILFSYLFVSKRNNRNGFVTLKTLIKISIFAIIAFFILFSYVGKINGKITSNVNPGESFLVYMGSSIVDLDICLQTNLPQASIPGINTFLGLFNTLSRFSFSFSNSGNGLGYIRLGTGTLTNVYTAFAAYIIDYGIFGMCILQMVLGVLYVNLFYYVIKKRVVNVAITVYIVNFAYGLVGQLYGPETLCGLFTVNDLLGYVILFFFWYVFENKMNCKVFTINTNS